MHEEDIRSIRASPLKKEEKEKYRGEEEQCEAKYCISWCICAVIVLIRIEKRREKYLPKKCRFFILNVFGHKMGFDLERFACELSPSLKCPICCKIFENPVQVDCVGGDKNASHIFCRSCLIETFASSDRLRCPIDGKLFKRNTRRSLFLKPPQELFDTLSSLPIKCSFPGIIRSLIVLKF